MGDLFGHESDGMQKLYHKTDWTNEQRVFDEKVLEFQQGIASANIAPAIERDNCKKNKDTQVLTAEVLTKKTSGNIQEKKDFTEDPMSEFVESSNVEKSKCDLATDTSKAQETVMQIPSSNIADSSGDPLKDIFDDDFPSALDESSSEDNDTVRPSPSNDKTNESSRPAKPLVAESKVDQKLSSEKLDVLKGFDRKGFLDVIAIANRMLSKVDRTINLDILVEHLDDYEVKLNIDRAREDIDAINRAMRQVQGNIDAVGGVLKTLVPRASALSEAWKYLEDVGILYTNATNREKRIGQVMLVLSDLWEETTEATRVKISYESRARELKGQWETLSRLMTFEQYRTQYYKDIHRGELPFTPETQETIVIPKERREEIVSKTEVVSSISSDNTEKEEKLQEPDIFETKKDDPLSPESFSGLEDFPTSPEKLANSNSGPKKKGEVNWDDF